MKKLKIVKKETALEQNNMDSKMKPKSDQKQVIKNKNVFDRTTKVMNQKTKTEQRLKFKKNNWKSTIKNQFMQKILNNFFDEIGADQNGRDLLESKLEGIPQDIILTVSS